MAEGIQIPGTDFRLPTWALLAGGAGLAALLLFRRPSPSEEQVDTSGLLSEEINTRLEEMWDRWEEWANAFLGERIGEPELPPEEEPPVVSPEPETGTEPGFPEPPGYIQPPTIQPPDEPPAKPRLSPPDEPIGYQPPVSEPGPVLTEPPYNPEPPVIEQSFEKIVKDVSYATE